MLRRDLRCEIRGESGTLGEDYHVYHGIKGTSEKWNVTTTGSTVRFVAPTNQAQNTTGKSNDYHEKMSIIDQKSEKRIDADNAPFRRGEAVDRTCRTQGSAAGMKDIYFWTNESTTILMLSDIDSTCSFTALTESVTEVMLVATSPVTAACSSIESAMEPTLRFVSAIMVTI